MSKHENARRQPGALETANQRKNDKPHRFQSQPLKGICAYEQLRQEWIVANPIHTEAELLTACVMLARRCGLILREKFLQEQLQEATHE